MEGTPELENFLTFEDKPTNMAWDTILKRTLKLRSSSLSFLKAQLRLIRGKLRNEKKMGLRNPDLKSSKMLLTMLRKIAHHYQT